MTVFEYIISRDHEMSTHEVIKLKAKSKNNLKYLTISALFAALTAIFITLFHISYGSTGYVHLGDAVIYFAAVLLPTPYAALAAAVGGAIADTASGYLVYVIPTIIAKVAISLPFTSKTSKTLCKRNAFALLISAASSILVYGVAEYIIGVAVNGMPPAGALTAAAGTILQNFIQAAGSTVLFLALSPAIDKIRQKTVKWFAR